MSRYSELQTQLSAEPRTWLVTGAAGFIGSHLVESLLGLDQKVIGLDNFATGKDRNLKAVRNAAGENKSANFNFIEGDITDPDTCSQACLGADYVLHQAALGSVPRSIEEPLSSHHSNVTGMLNMLIAARDQKVSRFVYASSSAVYGNDPRLPKLEDNTGDPISPYAATKLVDEVYANTFSIAYQLDSIGLRYFNVFGPRQDPEGAYAAVIPKWVAGMLLKETININGTGETTRDFCYIDNVVQANLLAATTDNDAAINQAYNIALHEQTSLNELFSVIRDLLQERDPALSIPDASHRGFRPGDVKHSLADIRKAKTLLGYQPTHSLREGLETAIDWYQEHLVPHT